MPLKTWVSGERVLASDLNENFANFAVGDVIDLVLGHDMSSAPVAVYVADGAETNVELTQGNSNGGAGVYIDASTERFAQSFTFPSSGSLHQRLKSIQIHGTKVGSPTGSLTLSLYAVDGSGKPTGSALSTGSITYASLGGSGYYEITMSAYDMVPGTQYIFVIDPGSGVSGSAYFDIDYHGTSQISDGKLWFSTDSGSTWADNGGGNAIVAGADIRFIITCVTIAGRAYHTSASTAEDCDNFIGFLSETGNLGDTKTIRVSAGLVEGFSGLTIGSLYYLSNTRGAIATSAGSTTRKIGIAISATQLLVIRDNV